MSSECTQHNTDEIKTVKSIKFSKEYGKQQLFPQQEKIEPLLSLIRISQEVTSFSWVSLWHLLNSIMQQKCNSGNPPIWMAIYHHWTGLDWTTGLLSKLKVQHYSSILGITSAITWGVTYPKAIWICMQHGVYIFINFECLRLWHTSTEREPTNDTMSLPSQTYPQSNSGS